MKRPETIVIDGRAYRWRVLLDLRRAQIEAWQAAQPQQRTLFALKHDRRPEAERNAAGRYREPTLLSILQNKQE